MGDLGGRTKSLIPYSCEDSQTPHRIRSLHLLEWPALERGYLSEFLEEHPGEVGRGPGMEGGIGPPRDKISGGELLIHLSRKGTDVQSVDGDEVSWGCHLVVFRFSLGMGSLIPPWAFCGRNPPRFLFLSQKTPGFEIPEDPPHGETRFPEKDGELCLRRSRNSSRSLCISSKLRGPLGFWIFLGFSTYPSGLWGFRGPAFSSTERRLRTPNLSQVMPQGGP